MTETSRLSSPERAAARMRARMSATGGGSRDRSVMISGAVVVAGAGCDLAAGTVPVIVGESISSRVTAGGDCGRTTSVLTRFCATAGMMVAASIAADNVTETRRMASAHESIGGRRRRHCHRVAADATRRAGEGGLRLLARELERELAVRDALGEAGGELGSRILTVGGDELAQRSERAGLRHAVAVDAVEAGFPPGLVRVADRGLLLLVFRQRPTTGRHTNSDRHV